jgi:catechol 2,3-dioxygenase-like lactoylglutathione lyase family enzyme
MAEPHPNFRGGANVAMKVPERHYAATLAFYRDILGLPVRHEGGSGAVIDLGPIRLWLDRVAHQSQADIWLELIVDDTEAASRHLARHGVTRCDEVEALPGGFDGFWIAAPAGTIHLVATDKG